MKKKHKKVSLFIVIIIVVIIIITYATINILKDKQVEIKAPNIDKIQEKTKSAKLTLVGDFLFEQPFYNAYGNLNEAPSYFELVKDYFLNDDLSIGNMEVVIGNDDLKSSGTGYNFCAPKEVGKLVNSLDLEVLATANNHSYDRGIEGINSTLDFFKNETDIMTTGTYKDQTDRDNVRIKNINGINFGFLSYTLGTNIKIPANLRHLVGLYRNPDSKIMDNDLKQLITTEVNNIKKLSDVIIVLMHWGSEFTNSPNEEQKSMAIFLNSLGVDIIVGSHSHSIQPIELIDKEHKTLVYYSLGNFVSADDDISRTGEKFDNAYQFGLLSTLDIALIDNKVEFNNITALPIINYYDTNFKNFKLVPFNQYNKDYETTHKRYQNNFNRNFISNMFTNVIDENYR